MEKETVLSGYCRVMDGSRMVMVCGENGQITDIDCNYPDCPYAPNCPIAEKIEVFLKEV